MMITYKEYTATSFHVNYCDTCVGFMKIRSF